MSILLITKKGLENETLNKKSDIEQSEIIRVISEDSTIMIDNVVMQKSKLKKYLVFDIVKLDKTIENVKFNIVFEYDGDPVFKNEIIVNDFGNNDLIKKKLKIQDLDYDFEELSVVLEIIEKNGIND